MSEPQPSDAKSEPLRAVPSSSSLHSQSEELTEEFSDMSLDETSQPQAGPFRQSNSSFIANPPALQTTGARPVSQRVNDQRHSHHQDVVRSAGRGGQSLQQRLSRIFHSPRPVHFSDWSSPAIPNSHFFSNDFLLGAGMVIIQPSTDKVVLVYESLRRYWFLPKGRKDIGESLEQAALREAYEEAGYRAEFLPLCAPTNQPPSPGISDSHFHTEPIYVSSYAWSARNPPRGRPGDYGGEYFTFWYVGQIPDDAVQEENTGMPDEQHYVSYLLDWEDALQKLADLPLQWRIVSVARALWHETLRVRTRLEEEEKRGQASNDGTEDVPQTA